MHSRYSSAETGCFLDKDNILTDLGGFNSGRHPGDAAADHDGIGGDLIVSRFEQSHRHLLYSQSDSSKIDLHALLRAL